MHLIKKRKILQAPDMTTLKHRAKWYIKNGWQIKTTAHLYWGWHGFGRCRYRVVLAKPVDIRDWCSDMLYRWYRWMGMSSMTVEDATLHYKGDWIRVMNSGPKTTVDKRKIIYIYHNELIICRDTDVSRLAWIHLLTSLGIGLLAALLAGLLIILLFGIENTNYNTWVTGLSIAAAGVIIAWVIDNKLEGK